MMSVDIFKEYIRTIAFYMIFAALIEIIAPSGSFKKYIRLISSLLLIALLIQPLNGFMRGGIPFGGKYFKFQSMLDNKLASNRSSYEKEQAEAIIIEYKKNLSAQAEQVISARTGLTVEAVNVSVNEDYESGGFASVLGADVAVRLPKAASGNISPFKKVLLGNADSQVSREEVKEAAEREIKKTFSDFYNMPEDNIHITVLED